MCSNRGCAGAYVGCCRASVAGFDVQRSPRQVRRNIGVLLVIALVYGSAALVLLRVTDAAARAKGELDWM